MHVRNKGWLPLALGSTAALALWALAAVHGYAWQTLWLPAAVAGSAWPRERQTSVAACLRRLRRAGHRFKSPSTGS